MKAGEARWYHELTLVLHHHSCGDWGRGLFFCPSADEVFFERLALSESSNRREVMRMLEFTNVCEQSDERLRLARLQIGKDAARFIFEQDVEVMDVIAEQQLVNLGAAIEVLGLRYVGNEKGA